MKRRTSTADRAATSGAVCSRPALVARWTRSALAAPALIRGAERNSTPSRVSACKNHAAGTMTRALRPVLVRRAPRAALPSPASLGTHGTSRASRRLRKRIPAATRTTISSVARAVLARGCWSSTCPVRCSPAPRQSRDVRPRPIAMAKSAGRASRSNGLVPSASNVNQPTTATKPASVLRSSRTAPHARKMRSATAVAFKAAARSTGPSCGCAPSLRSSDPLISTFLSRLIRTARS